MRENPWIFAADDARDACLRELSARLAVVEERERAELSAYLHDEIGQNLTLMHLKLDAFALKHGNEACAQDLKRIRAILGATIYQLRSRLQDLTPLSYYQHGIVEGLRSQGDRICGEFGIACSCTDSVQAPVADPATGILLYRAALELIRNAAKHSGATSISVHIRIDAASAMVEVSDNGKGFDPARDADMPDGNGFGLRDLRNRVHGAGGSIVLDSAPGKGARFTVAIPNLDPSVSNLAS